MILAAIIAVYLLVATTFALTKSPGNDEGWFAAPAWNLAVNGTLGMPALEPTGSWLRADLPGIREHTYWNMPLGMVAQGAWFRLFGFGLVTMRTLSIVWGLVALVSWFLIICSVTGDRAAAMISAALLSLDYTFLWGASDGRIDMMCFALGSAGMAAYLWLRERDLRIAILVSHTLAAAGLFTHPNGLLALLSLAFLALYYDAKRLKARDALACLPYFSGVAGWAWYASVAPAQFLAQFAANAGAKSGSRLASLTHPFDTLMSEIVGRYAAHFGLIPVWTDATSRWNLFIPLIYWIVTISVIVSGVRKRPGVRVLLGISAIFLVMLVLNGMRLHFYLIYAMPVYAALAGAWSVYMSRRRAMIFVPLLLCPLIFLQTRTIVNLVRGDKYHTVWQPAMEYIKLHANPDAVVAGNSTAGFALGFSQLVDDERIGYLSLISPDWLIADRFYPMFWSSFRGEQPEIARYIIMKQQSEYEQVFSNEYYTIYRRRRDSTDDAPLSVAKQ